MLIYCNITICGIMPVVIVASSSAEAVMWSLEKHVCIPSCVCRVMSKCVFGTSHESMCRLDHVKIREKVYDKETIVFALTLNSSVSLVINPAYLTLCTMHIVSRDTLNTYFDMTRMLMHMELPLFIAHTEKNISTWFQNMKMYCLILYYSISKWISLDICFARGDTGMYQR